MTHSTSARDSKNSKKCATPATMKLNGSTRSMYAQWSTVCHPHSDSVSPNVSFRSLRIVPLTRRRFSRSCARSLIRCCSCCIVQTEQPFVPINHRKGPNMDTSRGTTEGNLALLLDRSSVPIAEIGDEQWMKVIHAYRNELPLKWMRGFRTISDHLECKRTDVAVERKLAKKVNVLSSTVTARSGETYLNCLDVCSKF